MSLINLCHRLTRDPGEFDRCSRSSDSFIFVDREIEPGDGDASLDLTVGEAWFHGGDNVEYRIQDDGLSLKPGDSCVVETNERIGVPANAFGLVTGKGKYIFQGVLVSPGKMDPGFFQRLRIGLYNGGRKTAQLKKGEPFCTVCFLELDPSFDRVRRKGDLRPYPLVEKFPITETLKAFVKKDWGWILSILISIVSLAIAIWHKR
jgi:deoxycytidine triphosphate deaminase